LNSDRPLRAEWTIEADSRIWLDFPFREGDVIVASYHKAGTTVTQQIVSQLVFEGKEDLPIWRLSPWLDFRLAPKAEMLAQLAAQTHRRCIKTHLPADALPLSSLASYVYVARDGRDVLWSFHYHLRNARDDFNDLQWRSFDPQGTLLPGGYPPIPESPREFFLEWLRADGFPHGSFFTNVGSWWAVRDRPNVLLVHYRNLLADLRGQIVRIARFLGYAPDPAQLDTLVRQCGFDYMKSHAAAYTPMGGGIFKGGAASFFNQGSVGRWRGVLRASDIAEYERVCEARLGRECAHWLATGESEEGHHA
jgi:aryl sulfotransferase